MLHGQSAKNQTNVGGRRIGMVYTKECELNSQMSILKEKKNGKNKHHPKKDVNQ